MKRRLISTSAIMLLAASVIASSCTGGAALAGAIISADDNNQEKYIEKYGNLVTKELGTDNITRLDISGCADVVYVEGNKTSVKMETNEKAFALYDIKAEGGTLIVNKKQDRRNQNIPKINITVTSPFIDRIDCSGAGNIDLGTVNFKDRGLNINISGAGDIDAESITCDKDLTISISGAGDIDTKKIVCNQNVTMGISGAGDINSDVKCKDLDIKISGAGNADMKIDCENTYVSLSGAGSVSLNGRTGTLKKDGGNILSSIDTDGLTVGK